MATKQQEATLEQAKKLGLKENEFEMIKEILGRTPNNTEIDIFSVLWSERCSSKNSIQWLNKLPKASQDIVDLGDGIGYTIKIKERGKLKRDSFSSGAQPIAQLNAFYFGNIEGKSTKQDIKSVIKNVKDSTPVVGNELFFDGSYNSNPVSRQFMAGIVDMKSMISAKASGVGNRVFVVGIDLDSKQEKSLLEATIELSKSSAIVGIQDLGRGGIAGSSSEMAFAGVVGMDIWIDKISSQQKSQNLTGILTSEIKGRLLVVKKGKEQIVKDLFSKEDITIQEIGVVTEGSNIRYFDGKTLIADIPCKSLVRDAGAPQYERESEEPAYFEKQKKFKIDNIPYPEDLKEIAIFLLKHQNIASRNWIDDQLISKKGSKKMRSDATVVNAEGTNKVLALSLGFNARYIFANPQLGAAMIIAQAARDIVCSGGNPIAITPSLNFGNLYNPEHYWQFSEAIKGISKVCSRFKTSVINETVSFDKGASNDKPFFPTPTIGMLGVAEKENIMSLDFKYKGDLIFILGENIEDVGSSEYLKSYHKIEESPAPYFNLEKEFELQETLKQLIKTKYVNAVHSVSKGGIFIALAKMGMTNELGFDIVTDAEVREDAFLFGEAAGRIIATVSEDFEDEFIEFMMNSKTQFTLLGHVTKGKMVIDDEHYGFIKEAKDIYENALEQYIEK